MSDDISPKGRPVVIHAYDGADLKYIDWDTIEAILTALEKLDDLQGALDSVGTDELDVNVESSVLPTGAATETSVGIIRDRMGVTGGGTTGTLLYFLKLIKDAAEIIDGFADADNVLFGYNDRYAEGLSHSKSGAGTYNMDFTAVTSGEVWVIEGISVRNSITAQRTIVRGRTAAGGFINLKDETPAAVGNWVIWTGRLTLKATDYIRISFLSCLDGDALEGRVWGYKMKV